MPSCAEPATTRTARRRSASSDDGPIERRPVDGVERAVDVVGLTARRRGEHVAARRARGCARSRGGGGGRGRRGRRTAARPTRRTRGESASRTTVAPLVFARRPSSATVPNAASEGSARTSSATRRSAGGSASAWAVIRVARSGMERMVRSSRSVQQPLHARRDRGEPLMATFRSTNPARPAEVVIELPSHVAADVDAAVQRATDAQRAWARRPVPERAEAIAAVGRGPHRPQGRAGRAGEPRGGQDPHRGRRRGAGGHRHGRLRRRSGPVGDGATSSRPRCATSSRGPPGSRSASSG